MGAKETRWEMGKASNGLFNYWFKLSFEDFGRGWTWAARAEFVKSCGQGRPWIQCANLLCQWSPCIWDWSLRFLRRNKKLEIGRSKSTLNLVKTSKLRFR